LASRSKDLNTLLSFDVQEEPDDGRKTLHDFLSGLKCAQSARPGAEG
jgi:hypothetical protein